MQHVVVVDDAETNLAILAATVERIAEVEVHPFNSSREALRYAEHHDVDAFVLDYHMPAPDGPDMVRILRANARFQFVPIVIVTAEHERAARLDVLSFGANDYIERPVEPRELVARLQTLLALHAARARLSANVTDLEQSLRAQADRMVALWRIVTKNDLTTDDLPHAILLEGARAIRPPRQFFASLARLDGDAIVMEARTRSTLEDRTSARIGTRIPLDRCLQGLLAERPATRAWDDLLTDPAVAAIGRLRKLRARSAICSSFYAGRTLYFLTFSSREVMHEPFTPEDVTYVELLASFFSNRMEQAWQSDRISYQLSHDSLTGLRNRTQFRLDARAGYRLAAGGAVAVVDIDGFRYVNETHGHIIGDALLVEVGAELERRAIGDEVVGRLAGDTFGIFLPGLGEAAEACARVEVFAASFNRPFSTGDREGKEFVRLGATVGVAASTDTNVTIDTLLSRADTAVFAARRNGRGRTLAYEPGMESEEAARDRMLHEMSLAFERGEFEMYFQPHMDLERNRIVACEALIRWNHPTRGLLMPDEFIPFAEQNRSIGAISSYVMQASMDAAEELRAIDPVFRVYFNLSALDLADTQLVESFRAAASAGAPLENIGVEVTETAAIQDMGVTLHAIRSLQELGVCVAIDDFGIGYSSLSVLKRLPVDLIKIDRSFISEVLAGEHDAAISESVIAFGRRFGFATLGEGVETAEQLAWLAERGCRFAQGYHIAVPMPFEAFKLWLTSGQFSPSTVPL